MTLTPIALIKPYFKERRTSILIGLGCLITVDLLQLMIPRVTKWAVDGMTLGTIEPAALLRYALYIVGMALMMGVFRYFWRRFLLGTSRRVEEGLRNRLFSHLQTLSAGYFDHTQTGDLMAHATNDIQQIRMAAGMGLVAINDALVLGIAAIGFMVYINLYLTCLVLIPMPLIVLGTRFFGRKMHTRYRDVQAAFAQLTEAVRERFAGIRVVKAYTLEAAETIRVAHYSDQYVRENIRLVKVTGAFFPMMLLFTNLSLAIVLMIGGRQTITGTITPGDFVAFIQYLALLTWPMMAMGWVTNLIQRGRASLERIQTILDTPPEISDSPNASAREGLQGEIHWDEISFAYPKNDTADSSPRVLKEISLTIPSGGTLGIVGPPGSGKSTLLQLLPRIYDVSEGAIRIAGQDIRELRTEDLRAQISLVPQEPFLFAGSIRDNLTLGVPDISDKRLAEILDQASLTTTVAAMPQGLDTVVGEKGVILSGGQKQRIALARALLRGGDILLLDDPISQVDLATGRRISETLRHTSARQTTLIVSHRLSALSFADSIITLDAGRIVNQGNHDTLMAGDNYYSRNYRLQEMEAQLHAN
ncbi:MAG: ABC transporter ATP-binding protein [Desulfobacterales bacterium]